MPRKPSVASHWTSLGDGQWGAAVQYADGQRHDWSVKEIKRHAWAPSPLPEFVVEVKNPKGVFQAAKTFDSLIAATKYADRFITHAGGWLKLASELTENFHRVKP